MNQKENVMNKRVKMFIATIFPWCDISLLRLHSSNNIKIKNVDNRNTVTEGWQKTMNKEKITKQI